MSANMRVDDREFQATLRKLASMSTRPLSVFVTSRLFHVGKEAKAQTPIADRSKIQQQLGATITSEKVNSKGKIRRRYKYAPTKLVYALVNAARKKAGGKPLFGEEMATAAKKFIASRLRAVGTLRSGWSRALRILGSAAREFSQQDGPKVRNNSKATPAKDGWNPTASMEYRLAYNSKIDPRVVDALKNGFDKERLEMLGRLEKKVNEIAVKAGAK